MKEESRMTLGIITWITGRQWGHQWRWKTQKQEQGWETTMSLVLGRLRLGAAEISKCNCLVCM